MTAALDHVPSKGRQTSTLDAYDEAMSALTEQQQHFANIYIDSRCATVAARQSGYANPAQQGWRLMKNEKIARACRLGRILKAEEEILTSLEVLASVSRTARKVNVRDLLDDDGRVKMGPEVHHLWDAVGEYTQERIIVKGVEKIREKIKTRPTEDSVRMLMQYYGQMDSAGAEDTTPLVTIRGMDLSRIIGGPPAQPPPGLPAPPAGAEGE